MAATIKPDGTIDFREKGNALLSWEGVTRAAIGELVAMSEHQSKFEKLIKLAQLRQSCGVESAPLKIRRPEPYHG